MSLRSVPCLIILLFLISACASATAEIVPAEVPAATAALQGPTATPPANTPTSTVTITPTITVTLTPTPSPTPSTSPTPTPIVLIGAGDIAYCGEAHQGDEMTADLLGQLLEQFPTAHIFTAGDNVQGVGTNAEFRNCFGPTWGKYLDRIRPAPGNHDYMTDGGAPYYAYFGAAAGEAGLGYYSYNLGDWHIVVLNSNCNDIACGPDSRQVQWLTADLEQNSSRCSLLYWHHPRWSSGLAGSQPAVSSFWRTAYTFGAEIVVSGHDHQYERFAPLDGEGNPDPYGVRQFIAGTGGTYLRNIGEIKPHSEVRYNAGHGLLKFNLYPDHYDWEFIPLDPSESVDSGSGNCH
jgi:acid phosphatase type 7